MPLTVTFILSLLALLLTIASAVDARFPLWIPVLLLIFIHLLQSLPLGR